MPVYCGLWFQILIVVLDWKKIAQMTANEPQVTFYHVTPARNVPSILRNGLTPQIGDRSKQISESPAVFLFPSMEDAEDAVGGWLGDEFDDREPLALLRVTIPQSQLKQRENKARSVGYEYASLTSIHPTSIEVLNTNW